MKEVADLQDTKLKKLTTKRLGQLLIENNLITEQELEDALEFQRSVGGKLGDILLQQGLVKPEELAEILSNQLNVPYIDLKNRLVQPEAIRLIPERMARANIFIPLEVVSDSLLVVMAYPEDIRTIREIRAKTNLRVLVAIGTRPDIECAIDLNYRSNAAIEKQLGEFTSLSGDSADQSKEDAASTPVAQSLNMIIKQAVQDRASDIHFEQQEGRMRVRYRIDGILHDVLSLPANTHAPLMSRLKILADINIAEQRRPQDGQFSLVLDKKNIDIRVSTIGTNTGERATLRLLDKSLTLYSLHDLGLLPDALTQLKAMLRSAFGMILVGGPTGSGKTTTLYAALNQFNQNEHNILTIEDPIEYRFADINQIQVNTKAGITYATGLRAILRHDPDIILIGEIRDRETAEIAVQAALTGHLVLASIHANDAVGMLYRLNDLGVEPYLIVSTLIGLISQRMIRRVCTNCRIESTPSLQEQIAFRDEMKEELTTQYGGRGCKLCSQTGYQGRTGVFELLNINERIRNLIYKGANSDEIRREALTQGISTMKHDGMTKVKHGVSNVMEVLRCLYSIE